MARLAWFTPLPPVRSGVASYCAELLPTLGSDHRIDVYVDAGTPDNTGQLAWAAAAGWAVPSRTPSHESSAPDLPPALTVFPAWEFLPRHQRAPYDLLVYQIGNAACHDFIWPYLVRFPGLLVLHDGRVHHARARALVERQQYDDYRAEFRFSHPDADPVFAEYAINGFASSLYYFWPMRRVLLSASRSIAVHSRRLVEELTGEADGTDVQLIRLGLRAPIPPAHPIWQAPGPGPVIAAYGSVSPEKQIPSILRAFAATFGRSRDGHLLLVGEKPAHYDAETDAAVLGISGRVTVTGYVPDADLDAWIHAADIVLCLRWPTARETSGPWIRALGAGKPTVITAVAQYAHVPAIDARTGTLITPGPGAGHWPLQSPADAVCVSADLVRPDEALPLAMRRLAGDPSLRSALGRNARRWWEREHAPMWTTQDYRAAIVHTMSLPAVPSRHRELAALPHLLADGSALAREIVSRFGATIDMLRSPGVP